MPTEPITTTGTITERLSPQAYRVSLPNGKIIIAHPDKKLEFQLDAFHPPRQVRLEMTPYDFEKARIAALIL